MYSVGVPRQDVVDLWRAVAAARSRKGDHAGAGRALANAERVADPIVGRVVR